MIWPAHWGLVVPAAEVEAVAGRWGNPAADIAVVEAMNKDSVGFGIWPGSGQRGHW